MVFNIHFQLSGIVIVLIVCGLYFRRWAGWKLAEKIYGALLINVVINLVLDVASIIAINYRSQHPFICEFLAKAYLITLSGIVFTTLLYLLADIYQSFLELKFRITAFSLVYMAIIGLIAASPIRYNINHSSESIYTDGQSVTNAYVGCIVLIAIIVAYLIYKWNNMSHQRKNGVVLIIGVFMIAGVIQLAFRQLLLIGFGLSLAMLFIYMFMENTADFVDSETGLYNKKSFSAYLNKYYAKNIPFVVYLFSVNDFDFLQKTFGQEETNKLMSEQGYFCRNLNHIHSFRFAHHQIAMVAKKQNFSAEAIKEIMDRHFDKPYIINDTPIKLNVSACLIEDSSIIKSGDEAIYMLEQTMRTAKEKRVDKLEMINDQTLEKLRKQFEVEDMLQWALENDKFQVYYQPIYSVEKKCYVSAEALLRLWDQDNNFVSPDIFIPVAEKNGYILEIGNLVFEKVCKFISTHNIKEELGIEFVEINLSVVQCMQETLAEELHKKMKEYDIDPEFIIFEITETSMIDSQAILTQNMADLIRFGSGFALDDYGSGYSNLNYMIGLPFNIVKIDKELVWSYFKSEKGKIGLEFAIKMVKHLKMQIIAEGIETEEQLEKIVELGVDYIQGFYFSRPVNEDAFLMCCAK